MEPQSQTEMTNSATMTRRMKHVGSTTTVLVVAQSKQASGCRVETKCQPRAVLGINGDNCSPFVFRYVCLPTVSSDGVIMASIVQLQRSTLISSVAAVPLSRFVLSLMSSKTAIVD